MAYCSYKDVVYTSEYREAKKELEAIRGKELDDDPNYDGDAWHVVAFLIDSLKAKIRELEKE